MFLGQSLFGWQIFFSALHELNLFFGQSGAHAISQGLCVHYNLMGGVSLLWRCFDVGVRDRLGNFIQLEVKVGTP